MNGSYPSRKGKGNVTRVSEKIGIENIRCQLPFHHSFFLSLLSNLISSYFRQNHFKGWVMLTTSLKSQISTHSGAKTQPFSFQVQTLDYGLWLTQNGTSLDTDKLAQTSRLYKKNHNNNKKDYTIRVKVSFLKGCFWNRNSIYVCEYGLSLAYLIPSI